MRNCTGDGGGPFEVGNQVLISSHRKLLSSKAMVVNALRKRWDMIQQARLREASASESLQKCRKRFRQCQKTGGDPPQSKTPVDRSQKNKTANAKRTPTTLARMGRRRQGRGGQPLPGERAIVYSFGCKRWRSALQPRNRYCDARLSTCVSMLRRGFSRHTGPALPCSRTQRYYFGRLRHA